MQTAPILLFTYKRLDTLRNTVEALKKNKLAEESELFIFSDAARSEKDASIVNEVRRYIHSISGFKKIHITAAEKNKGLAPSIIEGVSQVLESFDSVIVLEDDLLTTPNFLFFMNQCLIKYAQEPDAFSISGYSFNLGSSGDGNDAYFINRGWSWGWATWKDRWNKVDWEVKDYQAFKLDTKAQKEFAKGGSDLNAMLDKQMSGNLDSWAIRWFYHQFRTKGLTIYPVLSKVYNDGFDQFATHTSGSGRRYLPALDKEGSMNFSLPARVEIDSYYQRSFNKKMGITARIISKLETIIQKMLSK
ncbi:hypothetical protein HNQ91_000026 [Filimonas zeae]|uniref:Glycosyl transferase n=1 Tax=Filimonas zeae TaxID=1737353 RepID=A0A917ILV9_9BACT|nr:glycosyltransferase [Filimonas zeae]MDR6337004.1 hypothetical protein [Filimonas zeae]GGH56542.1 glycosyl transferase [Filimonas zeae]